MRLDLIMKDFSLPKALPKPVSQTLDWGELFAAAPLKDELGTLAQQAKNIDAFLAANTARACAKSFTLGFEAQWGFGKTFLMDGLAQGLAKDYAVVHFNAWERSYASDPLEALVGELVILAKKHDVNLAEDSVARANFKTLLSSELGLTGLATLTLGLFDTTFITPAVMVAKSVKQSVAASQSSKMQKPLSNYWTEKKAHEALKYLVQQTIVRLHKKTRRPVLFIIDELDRCAPDYALRVLERIRHIMGDKKAIFMLAYDRQQLIDFIEKEQGTRDERGGDYLERFVDIAWPLMPPKPENFVDYLFAEHCILEQLPPLYQGSCGFLVDELKQIMCRHLVDVPLRKQKRLFNKYSVILASSRNMLSDLWVNQLFGPVLIWTLLFTRNMIDRNDIIVENFYSHVFDCDGVNVQDKFTNLYNKITLTPHKNRYLVILDILDFYRSFENSAARILRGANLHSYSNFVETLYEEVDEKYNDPGCDRYKVTNLLECLRKFLLAIKHLPDWGEQKNIMTSKDFSHIELCVDLICINNTEKDSQGG